MLGIFLDSETNGLNAMKHRIIEIAFKIIDMRTGDVKILFESPIGASFEEWEKSDPASLQVNGFSWMEVSQAPKPQAIGEEIIKIFTNQDIKRGDAVFICQNPSFDRIFFSQLIDMDLQEKLLWPYHWLDLASMYWAYSLGKAKTDSGKYPWQTGCSKDKIAVALDLPKEAKPHRAMNGVNHLLLCYESFIGFPEKKC
ncbi:MAG: 3'-5' exonuclease [Chlamydiales bacterium]|nr:3'-5' exonuclease [Chlamydiales bacterium]